MRKNVWKTLLKMAIDQVEALEEREIELLQEAAVVHEINGDPAESHERKEALTNALRALGTHPKGYCFCSHDRSGNRSSHAIECHDARAALRLCGIEVDKV